MPRIILLLLVLVIAVYLMFRFQSLPPDKRRRVIQIALIIAVGILMAVLALTGRLNWLIAAIGAVLPLLPRLARFFIGLWPSLSPYFKRYQQNKQSSMQTRFVKLQIDMLSGELQGEVLEGEYKGQHLHQMQLQQLISLLDLCKQQDNESAALLIAYLNRVHSGWAADNADSHSYQSNDSDMDEQQARDILGVSKTASKDDISKAHKRLMQKLHPDRGGSDYLAQQINRAKDILLK